MNNSNHNKKERGFSHLSAVTRHSGDMAISQKSADTDSDVLLFDRNLDGISSELLTISEVAEFFRISTTGVRRLQEQRSIPFLKVGGSVRFLKEDLLSYLRKQRVETIE